MSIAAEMTRIVIPMSVIVGVIGNSLNMAVLSLFYSSIYLIYRLLVDGYRIDPAKSSFLFCKLFYYFTQVCTSMTPHFIVPAPIDRFCVSSINARIRRVPSVRTARRTILSVIVASFLYFISTPVVIDVQPDGLGCLIRSTTLFNQVYVFIQLLCCFR